MHVWSHKEDTVEYIINSPLKQHLGQDKPIKVALILNKAQSPLLGPRKNITLFHLCN